MANSQEEPGVLTPEWEFALLDQTVFPPDEFPDPVQEPSDLGVDEGVA